MIFSTISMPIAGAIDFDSSKEKVAGVFETVKDELNKPAEDMFQSGVDVIKATFNSEGPSNYISKVTSHVKSMIAFVKAVFEFIKGLIFGEGAIDTDGDGVDDAIELDIIYTDPLLVDSDKNGIDDGDEDYDKDGLTNLDEIALGTELDDGDSDKDNLNDFDEINVYYTEPTNFDTDSDGVGDGQEISLGTDPLTADDSFEITVDSSEEDLVKASVDIELSGEQVSTLEVKQNDNKTFFSDKMPGYMGCAYDFSVDGSFDEATISFKFDTNALGENADPTIYYFNEEDQTLEALETTINGNVASAKTTHFSTYILVNRTVYNESFEWTDIWDVNDYEGVEVVLVIDDSGSMDYNDYYNKRLTVAKNLVNNLPQNSKIGIVEFDDYSRVLTKLTDDKELANSYLTTSYFRSSGSTYMYGGIESALGLYESQESNILKVIVVLSDGETSDGSRFSSVVSKANSQSVKIYSVGLGDFESNLESLSSQTGGKFYQASNADALNEIYEDISAKIDIETDTDGDGISDYYEDNMVIFSGVKFNLDKNNPDTDGDGLLDGEEITELDYEYNFDKTQVKVTGKLLSNPLMADTDGDGLTDYEEIEIYGSNSFDIDSDNDGIDDFVEVKIGYDPAKAHNIDRYSKYPKAYDNHADLYIDTDQIYNYTSGADSLENFVPQGLCFTEDYILVSMYDYTKKESSVIVVLDLDTHDIKTVLSLTGCIAHVGGLTYDDNGYIWVSGSGKNIIKISINMVDVAVEKEQVIGFQNLTNAQMTEYSINNTASALTYHNGIYYVCTFKETKDSPIYSYIFDEENDALVQVDEVLYVEEKAQGIVFVNDYQFVISQSYGRKNLSSLLLYTMNLDGSIVLTSEIITYSMSEGLEFMDGYIYVLHESKAKCYPFAKEPQSTINAIKLTKND